MVFSSIAFLCVFLPIVILLYYLLPKLQMKNALLIIVSLLFYAYGEPVYVLLMIFSTIANYIFGLFLNTESKRKRKIVMVFTFIVNIGLLLVFKYTDMILETVNQIFQTNLPMQKLSLPIGISFFTFQAMSYVIDVYRGEVKAQKNYFNIVLYVSFFPQLIAGPIVRYYDIQEQVVSRKADVKEIAEGFRRFIIGLSKKVLISNTVAMAVDKVFDAHTDQLSVLSVWIGAIAYLIQLYFDFSGYSDMAIGLGHMFGFRFLENFNYPYISSSIKEFWSRWHISLSTWFKEYLYIPLGGNRKGKLRTGMNKMIVFFSTGLWHGASWTFVLWGLWHGIFLLLEDIFPLKKIPRFIRHIYTMLVVCLGFVIFRAETLASGLLMIKKMFSFGEISGGLSLTQIQLTVNQMNPLFITMLLLGIVGSLPLLPIFETKIQKNRNSSQLMTGFTYLGSFILLVLCMLNLSSNTYNPFIYFRF